MSLREEILNTNDVVIEGPFKIAAWGGLEVYVRSLSGAERDQFESSNLIKGKGGTFDVRIDNLRARLVALSVCEKDGTRVFTIRDAESIGRKNAGAIAQIYEIAARLSGITKEDLDELAKNSSADQSEGSTSA
jgi:hypothetical protein